MHKYPADLPDAGRAAQEPTPRDVFMERRRFVQLMGLGVLAAATGDGAVASPAPELMLRPPFSRPDVFPAKRNAGYALPSSVAPDLTPREVAAKHNNFYELLPGQGGPAWEYAERFEVTPWQVEVGGLCAHPMTLDLDALFKFPHEERLYHFRCVERWAMNVPWSGFPLRLLIERARPTASARYLRFISANKPDQMPGIKKAHWYPWPYFEALRLDEAMCELAMVVTGVYGEPLLKQHGAPVRIIVPWKYGYKNPKSIVKIEFVADEPNTFWQMQPHEYGFLSNINPNVPHPRWSQETSTWLHNNQGFKTPLFNGYQEYVAKLYPDEPRTPQRPLREGEKAR